MPVLEQAVEMPKAYAQAHSYRLTTRSGLALEIRPIRAGETRALADFFDRVSEADRRFRFLHGVGHAGPAELGPLVAADHFRTESFAAFDAATGLLVGSGLLACDGALDTGEVAVAVAADYRGMGVGWSLLEVLTSEARHRGLRRVLAVESRENHDAISLERMAGFVAEPVEGDPALVLLVRKLR